jgi:hypothetical protein
LALLVYGLQSKLFLVSDIKEWYVCESNETESEFFEGIDELKKYEVLPSIEDES